MGKVKSIIRAVLWKQDYEPFFSYARVTASMSLQQNLLPHLERANQHDAGTSVKARSQYTVQTVSNRRRNTTQDTHGAARHRRCLARRRPELTHANQRMLNICKKIADT